MDFIRNFRWMGATAIVLLSQVGFALTKQDVQAAKAFWSAPGRYQVATVDGAAPFQVRLTTDGSLWLWAYNQKRGRGKNAQVPMPNASEQADWDAWIDARVAHDRWQATLSAQQLNAALGVKTDLSVAPAAPGPIPEALRYLVGDAPLMATPAEPRTHRISFGDGDVYELADNPDMPIKYPSYRFSAGVRHFGTAVRKLEPTIVDALFKAADISASTQRVFKAVSLLEGGFDSLNTYDTGWVSVGFIQFACLTKGSGSLGQVLKREKANDPASYREDFARFGLDVAEDGQLLALDLETSEVKVGPEAAKQIIADKRLACVFHRAGQKSEAFRVAQLQVARDQYLPVEDRVTATVEGQNIVVRVGDVIKSEAGMATLMDRKVNTGTLGNLAGVLSQVAAANGLKTVAELANYELDIVKAMRFRRDFLADETLSQPKARPRVAKTTSRGSSAQRIATPKKPVSKKTVAKKPVTKSGKRSGK